MKTFKDLCNDLVGSTGTLETYINSCPNASPSMLQALAFLQGPFQEAMHAYANAEDIPPGV
jgi:hypothetical protein